MWVKPRNWAQVVSGERVRVRWPEGWRVGTVDPGAEGRPAGVELDGNQGGLEVKSLDSLEVWVEEGTSR